MRKHVIGVMGGGDAASAQAVEWADHLGEMIARNDWVLLTGGRRAGVMDAASKGAKAAGGLVIGVLPGSTADEASDGLDVAVITGLGSARNSINVLSSDIVIACGDMSPGTLSEVALALKAGKPVVVLSNDEAGGAFLETAGGELVHLASSPEDAVAKVQGILVGAHPA